MCWPPGDDHVAGAGALGRLPVLHELPVTNRQGCMAKASALLKDGQALIELFCPCHPRDSNPFTTHLTLFCHYFLDQVWYNRSERIASTADPILGSPSRAGRRAAQESAEGVSYSQEIKSLLGERNGRFSENLPDLPTTPFGFRAVCNLGTGSQPRPGVR